MSCLSPDDSITTNFEPGDYIMVPRRIYPTYACNEYGGDGWEGLIMSRRKDVAIVRFTRATSADGRRYTDTPLQVGVLQACPLQHGNETPNAR